MSSCFMTNFDPSRWLKFPNEFKGPDQRSFLWKKLGWFSIPVGKSNLGMCGGVASAALDFFYSKELPPDRTTPPSSKDDKALFDWIKQRQSDSITLRDFWKYLTLMFANNKSDKNEIALAWEQIKRDIQKGSPVVIGLERAKVEKWYKIHQLANIIKNHQVVVWGFEEKEGNVLLHLYDPKVPDNENVTISFNQTFEDIQWNPPTIGRIYTIFKTSYEPKAPPIRGRQ